jgi:1-acyl-sn-glycerol-3-phosphate acyltransferase
MDICWVNYAEVIMVKLVRFIVSSLLRIVARIELLGMDKMPKEGGIVIAANHIGRLDVAMVYHVLDRDDIIIMVAEKYEKYAFTRWLTRLVNGIFVDRYNADFGAVRKTLRRLQQGGVLAVTPEGTRSRSGNLLPGKPGGIYMAIKAGVPILPVAVTGTEDYEVKARWKRLKRLDIKVVVGTPFTLPPLKGRDRDTLLQEYTDEIMCQIAALLPDERRGVYAGHPRLKDLLEPSL